MALIAIVNKHKRGAKKKHHRVTRAASKPKRRRKKSIGAMGHVGAWPNNALGHRKAAIKGWRGRRAASKGVSTVKRKHKRKAASPAVSKRRHKRRSSFSGLMGNPRGRMGNILSGLVIPSTMAAAGAIAVDVAYGFLPLPPAIKSGPARYLVKGASAVGLGMLIGMMNKNMGHSVAMGGLTVTIHGALRDALATFAPTLALGAYADEMSEVGYQETQQVMGMDFPMDGMGYQETMGDVQADYTTSTMGEMDYD